MILRLAPGRLGPVACIGPASTSRADRAGEPVDAVSTDTVGGPATRRAVPREDASAPGGAPRRQCRSVGHRSFGRRGEEMPPRFASGTYPEAYLGKGKNRNRPHHERA